ncbi:MAG TPA: Fic family protein [Nitriliruptorales bacterium]
MLFATPALTPLDEAVIARLRELRTQLRYQVAERRRWTGVLRRVSMARAIRSSNSIEGYHLSVEETAAIVDHEEPEDADDATRDAIEGYQDAMTYILRLADDPYATLDVQLLRSLHFMMTKRDLDARPGQWRVGAVYVHDGRTGELVYEGAPALEVPSLMQELAAVLGDPGETPPLVAGAMAHLNLVMIHPFKDGNGRMARATQSLVLAREGVLGPEFCSVEEELGRDTRRYYEVLAATGGPGWAPERDARPWLEYCLDAHHRQAQRLLRRVTEAERAWEALERLLATRDVPERGLAPLLEATAGRYLRNATYRALADVNDQTATRDLKRLVDADLLEPVGEKRGRRYHAAPVLQQIRAEVTRDRPGALCNVYDLLDE